MSPFYILNNSVKNYRIFVIIGICVPAAVCNHLAVMFPSHLNSVSMLPCKTQKLRALRIPKLCHYIQILTGAKVHIEKLCPEVLQCCTTERHNFSMLIEADSQYLFCYITENSKIYQLSNSWFLVKCGMQNIDTEQS